MSGKDPVGAYSADDIHALLQQIRAEQEMRQNSPPAPAPGDPATTDAKPSAATSSASKLQSDSELGVSQELSVEQMLDKIRREIAEEHGTPVRDNRRADLPPVQRLRWRS
jgi:hypothetical protein